jgi:hypothetical protein
MATQTYLNGRKKYGRPQAILFSQNSGTVVKDNDGVPFYAPMGYEIGSDQTGVNVSLRDQFLILSDHNRGPLDFKPVRIDKKERTVNGRMRSYHIADKATLSTSWTNLPSRGFSLSPNFDANGNYSSSKTLGDITMKDHTVDGGAGGAEMLDWYNNNPGSFWMFLAYDNRPNFGKTDSAYAHLNQFSEVVEVYFTDFSYSVQKRGQGLTGFDLWNINLSVEEA